MESKLRMLVLSLSASLLLKTYSQETVLVSLREENFAGASLKGHELVYFM